MPISLTSVLVHAAAAPVLEAVTHPLRSFIAAEYAPQDVQNRYNSWQDRPLMLPEAGALLDAFNRYYIEDTQGWFSWALRAHGVNLGSKQGARFDGRRAWLWNAVSEANKTVPGSEVWAHLGYRGILTPAEAAQRIRWAGGNYERWQEGIRLGLQRPSAERVNDAALRGLLDDLDWREEVKKAGGDVEDFARQWSLYSEYPSIGESVALANRLGWGEAEFRKALRRNRVITEEVVPLYAELRKGLPGISDLLRMANRNLFRPQLVGDYGLFDEFPEEIRPWFAKLGLDYPLGMNIPADGGVKPGTMPDLYWGMIKEILPLGSAYLAYQRFRPDQVGKYQQEVPGLRPFTIEDLRYHMRVAGYPPPMRDFLIALSHPPLGRRDIQQGVQFGGRDRRWAFNRYLDLGSSEDNAGTQADTLIARVDAAQDAWKASIIRRAHTSTVSEIEGLYDEGIIDRGTALSQLSAAGLSDLLSLQLLDLSDAKRARGLVRDAVAATGRDYLSGALSAGEAAQALADLGIKSARAGELMQIWSVRRSNRRKRADTGKILHWVGVGAMTADEARRRLANLGWSDPDLMLLTAEAGSNLDKLRQREIKAADREAHARAREVERLAREARTEHQRLITEANRIAPRSTLIKWLKDGVIDEAEFRAQMKVREYPDTAIEEYLRDAVAPKPKKPPVVPARAAFPKPPGSTHPSLGLLQKWYLTTVITRDQFAEALAEMGYGPDDVQRVIAGAELSHGKKGTTDSPPSPPP